MSCLRALDGRLHVISPNLSFCLSCPRISLVTTENYPDVMMPAYRRNWESFIFFGLFLVIGVFYIVPMSLAIVNQAFWNATGKSVRA